MAASTPFPPDFGARKFAERNRWFSWLGLCVGGCMVVGGGLLAVNGARDLASMPSEPVRCLGADCREGQWVVVTDAAWQCDAAVADDSPYVYAPIDARGSTRPLLAAVDSRDKPCEDAARMPAEGVIQPAGGPLAEAFGQPTRVLWVGLGRGDSWALIAAGCGLALIGLFCVLFYRARLRAGAASPSVNRTLLG